MIKQSLHTANVNTSYTVFFVSSTFAWAKLYSTYFPTSVQTQAFILCALFSLMLFVFKFLLNQFYEGVTVLRMVLLYFGLSAIMSFLSAVKGPIADGEIPAIQLFFSGSYLYASSVPVYIFASVFTFYGSVTLISSQITTAILEFIYTQLFKLLPPASKLILSKIDLGIDRASARISDELFLLDDKKGLIAVCILLLFYAVLYTLLLII